MNYPAYKKYKPSGVEWLGNVPNHWQVRRLKYEANYWVSSVDKVPSDDEEPVRLCNYTDVYYNDYIRPDMGFMEATAAPEEIRRFGLKVGDVLITKDSEDWSDIAVPALVVQTADDLVCGYHLAIVRPQASKLDGAFLLRCFQSTSVNQQFQVAASGITRYGLPKSAIGEAWLPIPSLAEQLVISNFLEVQTAKIDILVAKKQTLIEKLKERRSALISQVVTRGLPPDIARAAGLNPHPKLKPSGVDWLGDVPANWQVAQLRRHTTFITSGSRGWAEYYSDEGEKFIRISNLTRDSIRVDLTDLQFVDPPDAAEGKRTRIQLGDILFSITAYLGSVGVADEAVVGGYVNQHIALVRVDKRKLLPVFAGLCGLSSFGQAQLGEQGYGGTKTQLALSDILSLWIPVPPINEQVRIAEYLGAEISGFDALISKVSFAIDRLTEYRAAIITATVTGKIDLQGAAG